MKIVHNHLQKVLADEVYTESMCILPVLHFIGVTCDHMSIHDKNPSTPKTIDGVRRVGLPIVFETPSQSGMEKKGEKLSQSVEHGVLDTCKFTALQQPQFSV